MATNAKINDEAMRIAEARLLQFVSAQPVHIGVAMSRRLGKARYQRESKPKPKPPGPKLETQSLKRWRNETIYRAWQTCYPDLGPAACAETMIAKNARYLTSSSGYSYDQRRGEPPLDQLNSVFYLIRAKGLAVPGKGALRNLLAGMHKNSKRDFCG